MTIEEANLLLSRVYTEVGCAVWWRSSNRNLGWNPPIDVWDMPDGHNTVQQEIHRLTGGGQ